MSKIGDTVDLRDKLVTSGFTHCKACDEPMSLSYVDKDTKTIEDDVCRHCQHKAADAIAMDQYQFEGMWWDMHWPGKEHHGY